MSINLKREVEITFYELSRETIHFFKIALIIQGYSKNNNYI